MPGQSSTPTVSVVLVNWNTRDLLRACLDSLLVDRPALGLEVLVVDNGSTDGGPEMVEAEYPSVRLIRNSENLGFVRANNQGLAAATGDYLFMLNSDTEVRPGCLEKLVEVAASDPKVGAVGPRLLNPDGTVQISYGPFPRVIHRFVPSRFEQAYAERIEGEIGASPSHTAPVDWITGAALLFRRDVLERLGQLDERFHSWYQDIHFAHRLRDAGYSSVFAADAVVVHHGRASARKLDNQDLARQLFDSEYTYLRLHSGLAATWAVFALRMSKALVRWLLPFGGGRADAAFRLSYHASRFRRFCLRPLPGRAPGPREQ